MLLFSITAHHNVIGNSHYVWDALVNFIKFALEDIL
jgi:hypothetical protein